MTNRITPQINDRLTLLNSLADVDRGVPVDTKTNDSLTMYWDRRDDRWRYCPQALTIERHPVNQRLWKVAKITNVAGATVDRSPYMSKREVLAFLDGMLAGHRHKAGIEGGKRHAMPHPTHSID